MLPTKVTKSRKVKSRSLSFFFVPFTLFWTIVTLVLAIHYFQRNDWLGVFAGVIFLVICACQLFLFAIHVFISVRSLRISKASPQKAVDEVVVVDDGNKTA